jgi:hypothetical protein
VHDEFEPIELLSYEDEPQELFVREPGCSGSLIPDVQPKSRLASTKTTGAPKYKLLVETIRQAIFTSRLPSGLTKQSDIVEGLVEEAIAKSLEAGLLLRGDAALVAGAKKIGRKIARSTKKETRWYETDLKTGTKVRKSKSVMREVHPVEIENDDGKKEWVGPVDSAASDSSGQHITGAPRHVNQTAENLLAKIAEDQIIRAITSVIGQEDWDWALDFHGRLGDGSLTGADHQRYRTIRNRIKRALPDQEPL